MTIPKTTKLSQMASQSSSNPTSNGNVNSNTSSDKDRPIEGVYTDICIYKFDGGGGRDTICATMLKLIQINKCVLISDNKFELYFGGISSSPPSVWSPAARGQVVCTVQWGIGYTGHTGIPPASATATVVVFAGIVGTGRSIYDRWDHVDLPQKGAQSVAAVGLKVLWLSSPVAFDDVSFSVPAATQLKLQAMIVGTLRKSGDSPKYLNCN